MELYPVFRDNMILQREKPVAVFGMAKPKEQITVSLKQRQAAVTVTAEKNGYFIAYLPAQQYLAEDQLNMRKIQSGMLEAIATPQPDRRVKMKKDLEKYIQRREWFLLI